MTEPDAGATTMPRYRREPMPSWVPRAIVMFLVGVAALGVLRWLVGRLQDLLVILLVSLFLSFAIEPAVNWLEARGIRRGLGTFLTFVGLAVAMGVFSFFMGRLLVEQVADLIDRMPEYIEQVQDWANRTFELELEADELIAEFQEGGRAQEIATQMAGNIFEISSRILGTVFNLLTILLFTFYLVADGPRLRRALCSALRPDLQREVLKVWEIAIAKTGGYIYSRALLATISALFHWAAFEIAEVPYSLPLALWVGVMSQFIPVVGTYLAGALPLVIGLLHDPLTAVWVVGIVVVYQQIENYLLLPRVSAHTMQLHAAVAFGAVIAGSAILGVVGALLALPVAATVQAFVSTYLSRHDVVESALTQQAAARPGLLERFRRT
ncbi:AI-2E family transporter [Actinomarinicola tropica]|uniref:AI-2E family transporter n=1 Tax=Actinomarinicola tropica TaxID=2789776 RepID=A0A5Q2RNG9_9ACTN|nr:AI-2E family transporter [Actinomarinicola tropica]QGG96131.1 AI-2E family transporter [Actinomarinicola tropica]